MRRAELLERIQEVGGIASTEQAQLVLRAVFDALKSEIPADKIRMMSSWLGGEIQADWEGETEHLSDIFDTEEMLCEEEPTAEPTL